MQQTLQDWIQAQIITGVDISTIRATLQSSGYTEDQINEALTPYQNKKGKINKKLIIAIVLIIVTLLIIFLIALLMNRNRQKTEDLEDIFNPQTVDSLIEEQTNEVASVEEVDCTAFYETGISKGFNRDYSNDDASIPEECVDDYQKGFEEGRAKSAVEFAQSDDMARRTHLLRIAQALEHYIEDNEALPVGITSTPQEIGTGAGKLNLIDVLSGHIHIFPFDPGFGSLESTKYTVSLDGNVFVFEADSMYKPGTKIKVTR